MELKISPVFGGCDEKHLFESWRLLLYLEFVMLFHDFKKLREIVCDQTVRPLSPQTRVPSAELCHAVDLGACSISNRSCVCSVPRNNASLATLRWNAQMVIGARYFHSSHTPGWNRWDVGQRQTPYIEYLSSVGAVLM